MYIYQVYTACKHELSTHTYKSDQNIVVHISSVFLKKNDDLTLIVS